MDRPTFEELYRQHFDLARRAIRRTGVKGEAEVDDLAQETFIVVYRRFSELDLARGDGKGWIYRIAVNLALNYRRKPHARRETLMDPAEQHTLPDPGNTEARVADQEHLRLLLASTTKERRHVYELIEVEGFTLSEAALAIGIPMSTVDDRLRRARRDMQEANTRLQYRKTGGRAAILPIGIGAWLHLREITSPPPGAADRLWERIQSMSAIERGADGNRPTSPVKKPWPKRVPALLRRVMEPALGALGGAGLTLLGVHLTRAPARETTYQPPVTVTEEAEGATAAPAGLNGLNDETSPAMLPGGLGVDSLKVANPAALLALRKAQAAYVVGDKLAALDALGVFEREFSEDPLRISAERLRALVRRPLAATR